MAGWSRAIPEVPIISSLPQCSVMSYIRNATEKPQCGKKVGNGAYFKHCKPKRHPHTTQFSAKYQPYDIKAKRQILHQWLKQEWLVDSPKIAQTQMLNHSCTASSQCMTTAACEVD